MENYRVYLIFFMILAHIFDDFYLQGDLKKLKQKSFWQDDKNYPAGLNKNKYQQDWIPALVLHAVCWAIMIHLPIIILYAASAFYFVIASVIINAIVHGVIDHLKCNKYKINLWQDQGLHMVQIIAISVLIGVIYGV